MKIHNELKIRVESKFFSPREVHNDIGCLNCAMMRFTEPDESHQTLMIVDDESLNLRVYQVQFQRSFNVVTFQDPTKAIEYEDLDKVDLLVTDFRMPELNGYELVKSIKARNPKVFAIILTGYMDSEILNEAMDSDLVDKILAKPCGKQELLKALNESNSNHV